MHFFFEKITHFAKSYLLMHETEVHEAEIDTLKGEEISWITVALRYVRQSDQWRSN